MQNLLKQLREKPIVAVNEQTKQAASELIVAGLVQKIDPEAAMEVWVVKNEMRDINATRLAQNSVAKPIVEAEKEETSEIQT